MMSEFIQFTHPYLGFICLVVVLAERGYQMAARNEWEKLKKQAIDRDLAEYDRNTGQFMWK